MVSWSWERRNRSRYRRKPQRRASRSADRSARASALRADHTVLHGRPRVNTQRARGPTPEPRCPYKIAGVKRAYALEVVEFEAGGSFLAAVVRREMLMARDYG